MSVLTARVRWMFGTVTQGEVNVQNLLGATGGGNSYNCFGYVDQASFYIETDGAATCSYQIRTSRTSTGPWVSLSSGTLSTGAVDFVQLPGPFNWISPRIKTINSTANQVAIRMTAVD
jgi:hypothetical protein